MKLQPSQFAAYFREMWGQDPFPWQQRLAREVCEGAWPSAIDLPTASGKTACLDIAVFALAVQAERPPARRTVGRRLFFVVNRRVIVDEAHERALVVARRLCEALPGSVLYDVAGALRLLSGEPDGPPLDVAILRGGIYRDNRWVRSITQPTIITSTVDQVGSRLLFRGYGVSEGARPLHAALVANDCLILVDEAHISQPFMQTLAAVGRYRGAPWAKRPVLAPARVVPMTATPGDQSGAVFRLAGDDRCHAILAARLNAPKPARLVTVPSARDKKATDTLAKALAGQAAGLLDAGRRNIAVIVNRVATARRTHEQLRATQGNEADIHLAIGRMRPLDRDDLTAAIQRRVGKSRQEGEALKPLFVVATQCLEVGADFDFDGLVTECASLDALRQRFGRLNRTGRPIDGRGVILAGPDHEGGDDPIYGSALAATWKWLNAVAVDGPVDFGISAMEKHLDGVELAPMVAPRPEAPTMLPAYVDIWAQTSPAPVPEPDLGLFLHGPQRGEPDVQVCWRSDLPAEADGEAWAQVVSLCPPSSPECMPVPIGVVRSWLAMRDVSDEVRGDTFGAVAPEPPKEADGGGEVRRVALAWRGLSGSRIVRRPGDVLPGDTLVLPTGSEGWSVFGHIPAFAGTADAADQADVAERAFRASHGRAIMRLTSARLRGWPESEHQSLLSAWAVDPEADLPMNELRKALLGVAQSLSSDCAEAVTLQELASRKLGLLYDRYPSSGRGVVLVSRRRVLPDNSLLPAMDDGEDQVSRVARRQPVSLDDHSEHILDEVRRLLPLLPVSEWEEALSAAARLHDFGKADERFQALLLDASPTDVWAQPALWAKSAQMPATRARRAAAFQRSTLPKGFRHEMLSVQLVEAADELLPADPLLRDLALHLVASHHGHARPFAPVVADDAPPAVTVSLPGTKVTLTPEQRATHPPHRLDSGIADRFWSLTRRLGWWGLAYLEAVLRLADQCASRREEASEPARSVGPRETQEATR